MPRDRCPGEPQAIARTVISHALVEVQFRWGEITFLPERLTSSQNLLIKKENNIPKLRECWGACLGEQLSKTSFAYLDRNSTGHLSETFVQSLYQNNTKVRDFHKFCSQLSIHCEGRIRSKLPGKAYKRGILDKTNTQTTRFHNCLLSPIQKKIVL